LKPRPVVAPLPAVIESVGPKPALQFNVRLSAALFALISVFGVFASSADAQPTGAAPSSDAKPVASVNHTHEVSASPKGQSAPAGVKEPAQAPTPVPPKPELPAVAAPSSAQSTQTNTEQAKLVYDHAVAAYEEHRYRDAIDLFTQADALRPNPAFSFNIGIAYEDMGDSAMALLHYRAYLRQLPKASDREEVENRVRKLEGVLADKGLQQVTIISNPADAMVVLDGKPRGVSPWTGEVAPGAHVVTLSLEGYESESRDFDLPSRRSIDVPVTLKKAGPKLTTPVVDSNRKPKADAKAPWEHVRPVTWSVLGVSVASFGAALGFELSRSALEQRSQQADSEVGRLKLHEDARRSELWAKSFLMFAIGMGATSIVLGYQDIDDGLQAAKQRQEQVSFGCSSIHDCSVSISGSF
jgi:tetratricopeptide (TPR) repeat protein